MQVCPSIRALNSSVGRGKVDSRRLSVSGESRSVSRSARGPEAKANPGAQKADNPPDCVKHRLPDRPRMNFGAVLRRQVPHTKPLKSLGKRSLEPKSLTGAVAPVETESPLIGKGGPATSGAAVVEAVGAQIDEQTGPELLERPSGESVRARARSRMLRQSRSISRFSGLSGRGKAASQASAGLVGRTYRPDPANPLPHKRLALSEAGQDAVQHEKANTNPPSPAISPDSSRLRQPAWISNEHPPGGTPANQESLSSTRSPKNVMPSNAAGAEKPPSQGGKPAAVDQAGPVRTPGTPDAPNPVPKGQFLNREPGSPKFAPRRSRAEVAGKNGQTINASSRGDTKPATLNEQVGGPRVAGEHKQSILQDPQVAGTPVNTEQQPPPNGQTSAHSAHVNPPQAVFHENSHQPAVAGPQPEPAYAAKAPAGSPPGDSASLSEQIQESIGSALRQTDRQITVRLNPPELGKVLMRFQRDKEQITGLLEVTKAQTRTEIQQALPQIVRTLEDSGVQIKRIEVSLESDQQQFSSGDRTAAEQQGAPYEQGTPTSSYDREPDGFPGDRASGELKSTFTGPGRPILTDETVNVLV